MTFAYENKKEIYCIIEINKNKKVVLLYEQKEVPLDFSPTLNGSDTLNYILLESEYFKGKITFLASEKGK